MNRRDFLKSILISILAFFGLADKKDQTAKRKKKIPKEKIGWYIYEEPKIVILNDYYFREIGIEKHENS